MRLSFDWHKDMPLYNTKQMSITNFCNEEKIGLQFCTLQSWDQDFCTIFQFLS